MDAGLVEYLKRRRSPAMELDAEEVESADPGDMDRSLSPEPLALRERPQFDPLSLPAADDGLAERGVTEDMVGAALLPARAGGVRRPLPSAPMASEDGSGGPVGYLAALRRAQGMDDLSAAVGRSNAAMQQLAHITSRGVFQPQALAPMPSEVAKEERRRQVVLDYLKQQREDADSASNNAYRRWLMGRATDPKVDPLLDDKRGEIQSRINANNARADKDRRPPAPRVVKAPKPTDTGPKLNKAAETLRKEFNGLPVVKDYNDVAAAYGKMKKASENPSAAGDLSLIFGYMKMLDPGSTVREGEFANAQNAGGIDDKLASTYNRVLNGQRLTEDQRRDFIGRARQLFDTHAEQLNDAAERYTGIAKKSGADPEDVVIRPPANKPAPKTVITKSEEDRLKELEAKEKAGTLGGK